MARGPAHFKTQNFSKLAMKVANHVP